MLSTNEANSIHWAVRRNMLESWRTEVGWAWKRLPAGERETIIGVPCSVAVTIPFRDTRRRDPSNYVATVVKAMVDQLVQQGVWPDDNTDWITVIEPICVKGDEVIVRLIPR